MHLISYFNRAFGQSYGSCLTEMFLQYNPYL